MADPKLNMECTGSKFELLNESPTHERESWYRGRNSGHIHNMDD